MGEILTAKEITAETLKKGSDIITINPEAVTTLQKDYNLKKDELDVVVKNLNVRVKEINDAIKRIATEKINWKFGDGPNDPKVIMKNLQKSTESSLKDINDSFGDKAKLKGLFDWMFKWSKVLQCDWNNIRCELKSPEDAKNTNDAELAKKEEIIAKKKTEEANRIAKGAERNNAETKQIELRQVQEAAAAQKLAQEEDRRSAAQKSAQELAIRNGAAISAATWGAFQPPNRYQ